MVAPVSSRCCASGKHFLRRMRGSRPSSSSAASRARLSSASGASPQTAASCSSPPSSRSFDGITPVTEPVLHLPSLAPSVEVDHSDDKLRESLDALADMMARSSNTVVVTGAGVSTESGIPDYRSPGRPPHTPIRYQEYMESNEKRQRYWTRSFLASSRLRHAKPNASHVALAKLELAGRVKHILTQNVDSLHQRAGSKSVLELHGTLRTVTCVRCKSSLSREDFHKLIEADNPHLREVAHQVADPDSTLIRPDGDIDLPFDTSRTSVPPCPECFDKPIDSDRLPFVKPDLVFFGENMRPPVTKRSMELSRESTLLLCLGSTMTTMSAFRLVKSAKASGAKVAIVNVGDTRADPLADVKIGDTVSRVLGVVSSRLNGR